MANTGWDAARELLTDLMRPLDYLAKWEYATARRQASWPVRSVRPGGDGYRLELAGGPHATDQVRGLLAMDGESDWVLESMNASEASVTLFDLRWDSAAMVLVSQADDDAMMRVDSRWVLVRVPLTFTLALKNRLEDARDTETGNSDLLLEIAAQSHSSPTDLSPMAFDSVLDHLNADQQRAVQHGMTHPVTLIWGPPGTGKTTVITAILRACWQRGESVLVVAPTHQAVDEPLLRFVHRLAQSESDWEAVLQGSIQRWGSRVSPSLRNATIRGIPAPDLLVPDDRVERQARGERWRQVAQTVHTLDDHDPMAWRHARQSWRFHGLWTVSGEYWPLPEALTDEDREQLDREAALWTADASTQFRNAPPEIVGATITHAFLSMATMDWQPDVVIIDEATMSHMPAIAAMALLAARRLIVAGDFWQLPTIRPEIAQWPGDARASAARWMGRDIFAVHGITPREISATPALVALSEQHRMAEPICALVNAMAYGPDLPLTTAVVPPVPAWPSTGSRLVWIDTASWHPEATPEQGSWINAVHQAVIAILIAQWTATDDTVPIGIVTPFRPQARQLARRFADYPQVLAATAHRFQGSERAVMILDPVKIGTVHHPFLGDTVSARQLWNVAISRAQQQVILIAPSHWSGSTLPARLVRYFQRNGVVVQPEALGILHATTR